MIRVSVVINQTAEKESRKRVGWDFEVYIWELPVSSGAAFGVGASVFALARQSS